MKTSTITLTDAKSLVTSGEFPESLLLGKDVYHVASFDLKNNTVEITDWKTYMTEEMLKGQAFGL